MDPPARGATSASCWTPSRSRVTSDACCSDRNTSSAYRATDGEEGHEWQGTITLLLTTTGRKSGEQRTTPLIYQEHDGDYLIVASNGGDDQPPAWYLNLQADPTAHVQVKGDKFDADVRVTPRAEEKPEMWAKMTADLAAPTTTTRRRPTGADPGRRAQQRRLGRDLLATPAAAAGAPA